MWISPQFLWKISFIHKGQGRGSNREEQLSGDFKLQSWGEISGHVSKHTGQKPWHFTQSQRVFLFWFSWFFSWNARDSAPQAHNLAASWGTDHLEWHLPTLLNLPHSVPLTSPILSHGDEIPSRCLSPETWILVWRKSIMQFKELQYP